MDTPGEKERITFPQVSRRNFLQATSALITLPFISSTAQAQSPDASPEITAPEADKVVPTCVAHLIAEVSAIFGRICVTAW